MTEKNWLGWKEAFEKEAKDRHSINSKTLCTYGIKALDDSMLGIANNELVVIGADSGHGKSELALHIARYNAQKGKRVAVYALEGGYDEVIARMKWRDICDVYYNPKNQYTAEGIDMDYRKWKLNYAESPTLIDIEDNIRETYKDLYRDNLHIYDSKDGLTIDTFYSALMDFHKFVKAPEGSPFQVTSQFDVDLIIIDHLQYFSLTKPESELFEITQILKAVKDITEHHKIPVVLISHLRKKGKDRGFPSQEDFYGTSNIPKIANTAITLMPDFEKEFLVDGIFPTFMRIVKSRIGLRSNYAFRINFNLNTRTYEDNYQIYRIDESGYVFIDPMPQKDLPTWAKRKENNAD